MFHPVLAIDPGGVKEGSRGLRLYPADTPGLEPRMHRTPEGSQRGSETREYRMSFWDAGEPNGDWTDVAKVTVGA